MFPIFLPWVIKEYKENPQPMEQNSLSSLDNSEKFFRNTFFPWGKKNCLHQNCSGNYYTTAVSCADTPQKKDPTIELKEKRFSRSEVKQLRS